MKNYKILFLFSIFLLILILIGCNTGDYENLLFSQYIPLNNYEFEFEDYNSMLNNKNEEIQYNTIINLIPIAGDITDNISDNTSDKKQISQKIFNRIFELIDSKNIRVSASSMRFISFCIEKYNDKKQLLEKFLKIKSNNKIVVFEQIRALSMLVDKDTKIDKKIINKFLSNKSWLISRMTYELVNASEDVNLRNEMIAKYKRTNDEFEKLLILNCFIKKYKKEVFELFKDEILNTKSKRIKKYILGLLNNANDIKPVVDWLNENYKNFSNEDIKNISAGCYNSIYDDFSVELFVMMLKKGFDPYIDLYSEKDNIPKLFYYLKDNEKDEKNEKNKDKISRIENEILVRKDLKDKWLNYKKIKK